MPTSPKAFRASPRRGVLGLKATAARIRLSVAFINPRGNLWPLTACVVTAPAVPPWIAAARAQGCVTVTGIEMFAQVRELLVEFLVDGR